MKCKWDITMNPIEWLTIKRRIPNIGVDGGTGEALHLVLCIGAATLENCSHIITKVIFSEMNWLGRGTRKFSWVKGMFFILISIMVALVYAFVKTYPEICILLWASLIAELVKNPPVMQETLVWFLGQEDLLPTPVFLGFPCSSAGKDSACNVGDLTSIPGLERSPREGKVYPLQHSGLENFRDSPWGHRVSMTEPILY